MHRAFQITLLFQRFPQFPRHPSLLQNYLFRNLEDASLNFVFFSVLEFINNYEYYLGFFHKASHLVCGLDMCCSVVLGISTHFQSSSFDASDNVATNSLSTGSGSRYESESMRCSADPYSTGFDSRTTHVATTGIKKPPK